MVDAIVSSAIEGLSAFLTKEINTRSGVKNGVRWLRDELSYLQTFMRAGEARQDDERIQVWINDVRAVANDVVIVLERFGALQEHARRKQGFLHSLRSYFDIPNKEAELYDIGKNINVLRERVDEIKKRRVAYDIGNISSTPQAQLRKRTLLRRATSFQTQVDVVGFEDDFKLILDKLAGNDPCLNAISIHGMGGLGKTTLARKLYHCSVLNHFQSRAWVCVSQDYDIKDVLKRIIKSLKKHQVEPELDLLKMEVDDLLYYLKTQLHGHHYLVVIDDLWDIEAWRYITTAFPDKKNGSRVIITTRNKKLLKE